jgi:AhpD family alkylhydroperoxidase
VTDTAPSPRVRQARRIDPIAAAPGAYRAMTALHDAAAAGLEERVAELARIRASQINGCTFCQDLHTRAALEAGESGQRVEALATWPRSTLFTERERAALELAEAVTLLPEAGVPDGTYARAEACFEPAELAQLLWTLAAVNAWNRVAVTAGM